MKVLKKIIILFLSVVAHKNIFSYNKTLDSLKLALKNSKHDTTCCSILNAIVENIAGINADTALVLSFRVQNIAAANLKN